MKPMMKTNFEAESFISDKMRVYGRETQFRPTLHAVALQHRTQAVVEVKGSSASQSSTVNRHAIKGYRRS
jgi:hypothetical protein